MTTRYIEVHGTLPEAEEYVAEEFDLPGLVWPQLLVPPLQPSQQPVSPWVGVAIPKANGTSAFGLGGDDGFTGAKMALLLGAVAVGWVGAALLGAAAGKLDR